MPEITPPSLRHVRRIRDRRWLVDRERELARELAAVDAEQRCLAARFGELRRELTAVHALLWPPEPGYDHRKSYRAPLDEPQRIPPPAADAVPLRGRSLRRAAVAALEQSGRPLELPDLHRMLHLTGHRLTSGEPVKQLADALRYEEQRGRVRRVARGTYALA